MFRIIPCLTPNATAGALLITSLSLTGCLQTKLLGGGAGEGGATTTGGSGGVGTAGSGGWSMGGATMGGSGGAQMGGAGGSGGATMGGSGGAQMGGAGGSGGAQMGGAGGSGGAQMGGSGGALMGGSGGAQMGGAGGSGGAQMGGSGGSGGAEEVGWARQFGMMGSVEEAFGVAVDATGNVVVTGFIDGITPMDGITLTPINRNVFVAKLDPAGNVLWAKRFLGSSYQDGYDVAVDPSGNVVLAGGFSGTIDFGGGPLTSAGNEDVFVVKLDPTGNHLWSKRFGDAGIQPIYPGCKVAVDAAGAVVVAGTYSGTLDFGGGALSTVGLSRDLFLAKLDANGNHVYSHRYGDTEVGNQIGEKLRALAVDGAGNAILAGSMDGSVDFGGGALAAPVGAFAAKIGPTGNNVWSKVFGATFAEITAFTVTPQNDIVFAGTFTGGIDFGAGPLNPLNGYGFLVKLGSAGQVVWTKQHAGDFHADDGATSAAGDTTFAGYVYGELDLTGLGGAVLPSFTPSSNAVIVTLAADGSLSAARNYSVPSMYIGPDKELRSVAYDPSGFVVTAGYMQAEIDMGFGLMDAGSSSDILVARLPPTL